MLDFMKISARRTKRGNVEIYPKFIIKKSKDLMIRGGDFYATWIEQRGLWSIFWQFEKICATLIAHYVVTVFCQILIYFNASLLYPASLLTVPC